MDGIGPAKPVLRGGKRGDPGDVLVELNDVDVAPAPLDSATSLRCATSRARGDTCLGRQRGMRLDEGQP
jgi:hypothetical protein